MGRLTRDLVKLAFLIGRACSGSNRGYRHVSDWQHLSGVEFERAFAALLKQSGCDAKLTPATGDQGVDIWIRDREGRIAVQCKCYSNPVGVAAARELLGTMHHLGVRRGWLASVSGFTKGVREFVPGKGIRLVGPEHIQQMQRATSGHKSKFLRSHTPISYAPLIGALVVGLGLAIVLLIIFLVTDS